MELQVAKIIWAKNDPSGAHWNHLHVEGPHVSGRVPTDCTSRWTTAIRNIVDALNFHFGMGGHFQVWNDQFAWTHMGVYNCRNIQPRNVTPSQHAFSNAIDIGPYFGVAQQQKFYDFLTGKEGDMTPAADKFWQDTYDRLQELDPKTNHSFAYHLVQHVRNHPSTSGVDSVARQAANRANQRLDAIRNIL